MAAEVLCAACGTANEAGRKFCGECGSSLATACAECGTPNAAGVKFCGECGAALTSAAAPGLAPSAASAPAAERRLVSVLFADLVGFTTVSEGRDAEEARELLSRYFETARTIVDRYGGTIEKFIGDAVMAVWGTPAATEDDAERAVRAALELVATIPELHAGLEARAGVLTGEAAVTLGAEGQGMVAGDLVNTASRIQSAAQPGTVLVGDATRGATEAAIAFEDGGVHELKGKAEPMQVWRAVRVVANRGGEGRSAGLEAPFVGRDRELRIVKDLFQASADERRAHLVLVSGSAGIGKSRLAWEFEKYIDGLTADIWWHRGRCLSYGEGVAYWALAEMVRGRARILESEDAATASAKLTASIAEHVPDEEDRDWIEPRLAHLLGLADASFERDELFAGVAPLLRAPRRRGADRARVRGPAMGGCRPPRLRRVPRRVGAREADLRPRTRPARACGPAPGVRHGDARRFHRARARTATRRRHRRAARGARPRTSGDPPQLDPSACRRHSAVCGGDRSDAPEPRSARGGRRRLPRRGHDRRARGPGDAARARRIADRQPRRRRAAPRPGRLRARQDVRTRRAGQRFGGLGRRAGADPEDARAQGAALPGGRSALGRARAVRVLAGPRPSRRLRDVGSSRPQSPASGGRGLLPGGLGRPRTGGRRGRRVALRHGARSRPGSRRRGHASHEGARDARARRGARRISRRKRRSEPDCTRVPPRSRRAPSTRRGFARPQATRREGRGTSIRRARSSFARSSCTSRPATFTPPRA